MDAHDYTTLYRQEYGPLLIGAQLIRLAPLPRDPSNLNDDTLWIGLLVQQATTLYRLVPQQDPESNGPGHLILLGVGFWEGDGQGAQVAARQGTLL